MKNEFHLLTQHTINAEKNSEVDQRSNCIFKSNSKEKKHQNENLYINI